MNFFEAISSGFAHYADFSGRARRAEYWFFFLFVQLVNIIIDVVWYLVVYFQITASYSFSSYGIYSLAEELLHAGRVSVIMLSIAIAFNVAVFLPMMSVSFRRLHDIGRSGGTYFRGFIPFAGPIIMLCYYVREGEPGRNEYGPDPKNLGASTAFGMGNQNQSMFGNSNYDPYNVGGFNGGNGGYNNGGYNNGGYNNGGYNNGGYNNGGYNNGGYNNGGYNNGGYNNGGFDQNFTNGGYRSGYTSGTGFNDYSDSHRGW